MKVAIIGPGALGCLLASSLTIKLDQSSKKSFSLDLWLLDHNPERARYLTENGLILEEGNQKKPCSIKATANPEEIGPADIVILCVKSPQVSAGLQQAAKLIHTDTLLLTLQNGIGHLELLKDKQNLPSIVLGVTSQGANVVAPGHVRHAGDGLTRIGFLQSASFSKSLLLAKACNLLNYGGIETVIVDNILDYVWSKLLINVGINAGIQLTGDPLAITLDVCRKTGQNLSSMLQDVNNRRPTEIDSINGEIAAALLPLEENSVYPPRSTTI
jgi:2-dehydropantoate 2-reductase